MAAKIEERKAQDQRERLLREQELAERQRTRAEAKQLLKETRRALEAGRARDALVKVKAGEAEDSSAPGATELRVSIVRSLTDSARGHLAKPRHGWTTVKLQDGGALLEELGEILGLPGDGRRLERLDSSQRDVAGRDVVQVLGG